MYCKHNSGGSGCIPCAIEQQTKEIREAINENFNELIRQLEISQENNKSWWDKLKIKVRFNIPIKIKKPQRELE